MATDACEDFGLTLGDLSEGLAQKLKHGIPDWVPAGNPIDIWPMGMIGRNYREIYRLALTELLKSRDIDAVLSIIPDFQSPLHPETEVLEAVRKARQEAGSAKPAAMWLYMTTPETEEQFEKIDGVACFGSVEQAVQGLSYCRRYHQIRRRAIPSQRTFTCNKSIAETLIRKGRREKVLAGDDALQLIAAFGIPVVRGITGRSPEEIKKGAAALHYPLVLKLAGKPFLHKSEWGGVTTGINNPKDLSDAMEAMTARVHLRDPQVRIEQYQLQEQARGTELLLGITHDPNFGQVLVCGLGGIYTEVFKDISRELVPVGRAEAQKMLSSLKIYPLLKGARGEAGIDWEALQNAMERLSFLATEIPDLAELDINPLMADAQGCVAIDARILW